MDISMTWGLEKIDMMRELVIDLLNLWVIVPDYFDMDWYLMFMVIVLGLLVDGSVTIVS